MKMSEIAPEERPREKMLALGPQGLSNGELLAVLIRNGSGGDNALDLARKLLAAADGRLSELFSMSVGGLCRQPGIGACKAASLLAAFELGRRFLSESSGVEKKPVLTARMVYSIMIPRMKGLCSEECWALFLNNSNYLLSRECVSRGGLDSTVMDVRTIVRMALEKTATGVVLVHNHPTGNPRPSRADISRTEALKKALGAFSIDLMDHVIVSDDCFYSFSEDRVSPR